MVGAPLALRVLVFVSWVCGCPLRGRWERLRLTAELSKVRVLMLDSVRRKHLEVRTTVSACTMRLLLLLSLSLLLLSAFVFACEGGCVWWALLVLLA